MALRLLHRQADGAVVIQAMPQIVDQPEHGLDVPGRPVAFHQAVARGARIGRSADHLNDLIDIGDSNRKAHQDMGAVAGLVEQELGAAGDDLFAEGDEGDQKILQVHHLRTAAVERQHVGGKIALQRREAIELVQHHVRHRVALQLDHDAKAVAVGFVAQIAEIPSIFFSRTSSAMRSTIVALFSW